MNILAEDFHRTDIRKPLELYKGLDGVVFSLAGWARQNPGVIGQHLAEARAIDEQEGHWKERTDTELRGRLAELKECFRRRSRGYEKRLPEALGAAREAAFRCLGLRPYVVQLAGALALYHGFVAEMATGEGKTLTAALAAVIHGWTGLPCQIITVNDYLAARDANWMGPLYRFCGVSVGCVTGEMTPEARREGHRQEVTYTTNKEIVADFLRDRLWLGSFQNTGRRQISALLGHKADLERGLVMRGIHSAIVDEADSILIDEAVTPLIISRAFPNEVFTETCQVAFELASELHRETDYTVDYRYKEIELAPSLGDRLAPRIGGSRAQYRGISGHLELIRQALTAREFFHRDNQYVIQGERVVIVDEFTGRQMPQRFWQAGLHQFIEAKENLPITSPTETLARLSFQRFYRFFHLLSGMTGTAREAVPELWDIYRLPVVTVPENRPCVRKLRPVLAFADQESKWQAIVEEIRQVHATGRPILVGTRSVQASEMLSGRLERVGIGHRVLNAVRHREEAGIVALAGEPAAVTIATNMAGRGTDIRLGKGVAALGGLHVIATEGHESQRIDRQLFGRCARQGDPGSARLFVSMEDEIVRRFLPGAIRRGVQAQLRRQLPAARPAAGGALRWAQAAAQRLAYQRRRAVLRTDTWLEDSLSFAARDVG
jgi:preprotein translocase subunit SecA